MIGKDGIYLSAVNSVDSDVRISKRAKMPYNELRNLKKIKLVLKMVMIMWVETM